MLYTPEHIAELEEKRDFLDEQTHAMRYANEQSEKINRVEEQMLTSPLTDPQAAAFVILMNIAKEALKDSVAVWNKLV